jgi:hypothetical protein
MGHKELDDFIDETKAAQGNIVFPDTVRNGRSVGRRVSVAPFSRYLPCAANRGMVVWVNGYWPWVMFFYTWRQ